MVADRPEAEVRKEREGERQAVLWWVKDKLRRAAYDVGYKEELVAVLEAEVATLTERLETRKVVERAKGLMMEDGMTEPEAFRWIQRTAMDRRTTMRAVAEAVVAAKTARPAG